MNQQRRKALKVGGGLGVFGLLVAAGLIRPGAAWADERGAFQAKTLQDALKALGAVRPEMSASIRIDVPDIAENGALVPVSVTSDIPKTERVSILVEKNPFPAATTFTFPEGTLPEVQTRLKMSETSDIYVVVEAEGKLYMNRKSVMVTLGGCAV